ncbi:penicillin binding protein PBP4B [Abyssisolibacter fermentans]|uniref:penicillin binding protein PBP4B n=1 Tax=Abyssisolibacter fermentans TaxID=1766203 RepID=UPI000833D46E|nr:penicillin binding protein PBP4B [Abyssisolibacter fermentans]
MKKLKISALLVVVVMLFTSSFGLCADNNLVAFSEKQQTFVSQFSDRFPEENPTSRVLARSRRVFKGYENEGTMMLESHGATYAKIYINGEKVSFPPSNLKNQEAFQVDISKYTKNGENTLKVLGVKPENAYINVKIGYPTLSYADPETVGFDKDKLKKIDKFINDEVKNGFPGAVLLVVKDGKIVKNTAYGYKKKYEQGVTLDKPEKMEKDTMFDLASNSKMYATNLAIQKLVSEGKIDLEEYVSTYIPEFAGNDKEKIKVRHLLTHTSGFDSTIRFYTTDKKRNPLGEEFYSQDKEKTFELICKAPLKNEIGKVTKYSDLGFMTLGFLVEKVTGQPLDQYVEENIYQELGLEKTMYNPTKKGIKKEACAATEVFGNTRGYTREFPNVRKYTLQGEVHDEKAFYSMGGVSGHAGLFSTSEDLAVLCQLVLNKGGYGNVKVYDANVGDQFAKPSYNNDVYGLGWNRAANMSKVWMFGPYASNQAIGHTGWTGTLTIIDPEYDLAIVLLTNKKHSTIKDGKFAGDAFQTGGYGSIVSMVYEAFLENQN